MRICILGNGLSGLTLAKALVNENIYVDMLVQKQNVNINQSRTLGISKSNIDFFNKNIINIKKLLWEIKKIEIFTDNLENEKLIHFENYEKTLFSIVKNFSLLKVLDTNLSKNKYFKKKLSNNKNLSFINDYELIINCDYSHIITKKFFNKKIIKKYNSYAYTTIITHQKLLNDTATQIFTKKGPIAFLPISDEETSVVYSSSDLIKKETNDIEDLIKNYNLKYKIKKINKIDNFELKSLNLRSYTYANILAFGDLLHRVHPLAGQGFNMTIRDIKTLVSIINKKLDLGLPLDRSVNEEFENTSRHTNFIFSNGVDFIHNFFNIERKIKSKIFSKSVKFIACNKMINKAFTKIADKGVLF